jgi:hypothetical protein
MIPFLSAEPKVPGDIPARVQLGQTGGVPPGRRFDSFMSQAADAEDTPVDGTPADDLLVIEEPSVADFDMSGTAETLTRRNLPDPAAPVAVLARPVLDAEMPEEGVPIRNAAGLDKTTLPPRAGQVWAALLGGERPAPPSHAVAKGKPLAAVPAAVRPEQPANPVATSMAETGQEIPLAEGDEPILPQRNLPERATARVPHVEEGRVPGLVVAQVAQDQHARPKESKAAVLPSQEAEREPPPRAGTERPVERLTVAVASGAMPSLPVQAAVSFAQERTKAETLTGDAPFRAGEILSALAASTADRPAVSQASAPAVSAQAASPEMARHAASQMAVAITQSGGRATEIALNPEELGRVRMSLSAGEASVSLTVFADRPETVDLLRRHIEILAQEFRALGYADIQFTFSSGDQGEGRTAEAARGMGDFTEAADNPDETDPAPVVAEQGVDLRL